jgi:alpha-mannosidase
VHLNDPGIRVLALKKAEDKDAFVIRLVELHGKDHRKVAISFASPITSAEETNGQEDVMGAAKLSHGAIETSFTPYQPRTFELHLARAPGTMVSIRSTPITLRYDSAVAGNNDRKVIGGFDTHHNALPADLLPAKIDFNGVTFQLGKAATGKRNAVTPNGQRITMPPGNYNRLYILAAAEEGDQNMTVKLGSHSESLKIENWTGFIGQWDTRQWKPLPTTTKVNGKDVAIRTDWQISANYQKWDLNSRGTPYVSPSSTDYLGLKPGLIKRDTLAWFMSHYITADGLEQPYAYSYLFGYSIDVPKDARTITLPNSPNIRILAMTAAKTAPRVTPTTPLYDSLEAK